MATELFLIHFSVALTSRSVYCFRLIVCELRAVLLACCVITSDAFEVPTTAAKLGGSLAVINAKFDTGFPPTAASYEAVIVAA